jgi:hypothetical protein
MIRNIKNTIDNSKELNQNKIHFDRIQSTID